MAAVRSCLVLSSHTAVVLPKVEKKDNLFLKLGSWVGKSITRTTGVGLALCFGSSLRRYLEVHISNSKLCFMWAAQGVSRAVENCFTGRMCSECSEINRSASVPLIFRRVLYVVFEDNLAGSSFKGGRLVRQDSRVGFWEE